MKCVEIVATTGFEGLRIAERPTPKPGPRQVLVRMRAASFNWRDIMILKGGYMRSIPLPRIPLSDGAGEVIECGAEVTRVKQGDRVCGIFFQHWLTGPVFPEIQDAALGGTAEGVLAEYVVLEGEGVVKFPDHLSFAEAATLPCAGVTAWHGLIEAGGLCAGDTALLLGTGGVSVFGLQFARAAGANAIITSSSDEKLERAKSLGATGTVNYAKNAKWCETVRELTQGRGADATLDVAGGESSKTALEALRHGGHAAVIGARSGVAGDLDRRFVLQRGLRVTGINVGSRAMFEAMNRAIAAAKLKPAVDKTYPIDDAVAAYRDFATGRHFGKVVVTI
ncbi:MAG TPA: NAD(P)-dependent alcohol dehydrogenase [Stellaceae bacterium]|jgi:NADPH:quinone reductase-like Zn-dependent oxidoreductase|nr:NAD(P)-dependent alcohol dehydrogenase [Stellaceae bacterium]